MIGALLEVLRDEVKLDDVVDGIGVTYLDEAAVVTLARPDRHNALTLTGWRRLAAVFADLAAQPALRVVVVRGAGARAFAAGADIAEFPDVRLTPADAVGYSEAIAVALRGITSLPAPVLAMVGGLALGGGCELAAACDVRLAGRSARFGIPIARLGVTLGYAEAAALVRLIGPAQLKLLVFSGEAIDATEALRIGLVQRVVDDDRLIETTADLAGRIVAGSAATIRATKAVADMCGRALTPADVELLTRATVEAYGGPDLKEGVAAFTEKRPPVFGGEGRTPHGRP